MKEKENLNKPEGKKDLEEKKEKDIPKNHTFSFGRESFFKIPDLKLKDAYALEVLFDKKVDEKLKEMKKLLPLDVYLTIKKEVNKTYRSYLSKSDQESKLIRQDKSHHFFMGRDSNAPPLNGIYYFAATKVSEGSYNIHSEKMKDKNQTMHAILARGQDIAASGFLYFKHGKLEGIDNNSGHYQPPSWQIKEFLSSLSKELPYRDDIIFYDYSLNKKTVNAILKEAGKDPQSMSALEKRDYILGNPAVLEQVKENAKIYKCSLKDFIELEQSQIKYERETDTSMIKLGMTDIRGVIEKNINNLESYLNKEYEKFIASTYNISGEYKKFSLHHLCYVNEANAEKLILSLLSDESTTGKDSLKYEKVNKGKTYPHGSFLVKLSDQQFDVASKKYLDLLPKNFAMEHLGKDRNRKRTDITISDSDIREYEYLEKNTSNFKPV